MNRKLKWTLGIIGTILLGALGSGLWSVVFAPLGSTILKWLLSIVTLGIASARDALYVSAALGYRERPSLILLLGAGVAFAMVPPFIFIWLTEFLPRLYSKLREPTIVRVHR